MSNEQVSGTPIRAKVGKILPGGRDSGPYAVAYPLEDHGELKRTDSITFSLRDWHGPQEPQWRQLVDLRNVTLYEHGWRSTDAQPIIPQG